MRGQAIADGALETGFCVGSPYKCGSNANGATDSATFGSDAVKCDGKYYVELTFPVKCKANSYGVAGMKLSASGFPSCSGYYHPPSNFVLEYKDHDSGDAWAVGDQQVFPDEATWCTTDESSPNFPTWYHAPTSPFGALATAEETHPPVLSDTFRLYIGKSYGAQSCVAIAEVSIRWTTPETPSGYHAWTWGNADRANYVYSGDSSAVAANGDASEGIPGVQSVECTTYACGAVTKDDFGDRKAVLWGVDRETAGQAVQQFLEMTVDLHAEVIGQHSECPARTHPFAFG